MLHQKELIKIVTAGSVDDGKSTLIGRLLYETDSVYEDQLETVRKISKKHGSDNIDFSFITDGLSAEREQGITIDVAYRYFSTNNRKCIVADVPGHTQYTKNMITGASNVNMALILVDARKGLIEQTKRHLFLASLLGIPHIALIINKMDLVEYDEAIFNQIVEDASSFVAKLAIKDLQFIPISALQGDMVVNRSDNMSWYRGFSVLDYIDNTHIKSDINLIDFRMPVQLVLRTQGERWYAGRIASGTLKIADEVVVLPTKKRTKIKSIYIGKNKQEEVFAPQSISLQFTDEIDVSRGDMVARVQNQPTVAQECEAMLFWMGDEEIECGESFLLKQTTRTVRVKVHSIIYKLDMNTLHHKDSDKLQVNDVGRVTLQSAQDLLYDSYAQNHATGSFILIDEMTKNTVAAGIIRNIKKDNNEE